MDWRTKLLIDNAKATVPFRSTLKNLKRKWFPGDEIPARLEHTLNQGLEQVRLLRRAGVNFHGQCGLELGTGWQPIIPLLFHIAGADRVHLVDADRILTPGAILKTVDWVRSRARQVAEGLGVDLTDVVWRTEVDRDADLDGMLSSLGFRYWAPYDVCELDIRPQSLDFITSRAVLEHIPRDTIEDIMRKFADALKPHGGMCHMIDHSDHFEHADHSIDRVHFLQHSDAFWRFCCLNEHNFQNRMRHSEYVSLFQDAGFDVTHCIQEVHTPTLRQLDLARLNPRFTKFEPADLATISSSIVLEPQAKEAAPALVLAQMAS